MGVTKTLVSDNAPEFCGQNILDASHIKCCPTTQNQTELPKKMVQTLKMELRAFSPIEL